MVLNHGVNAQKGIAPFISTGLSETGIPMYFGSAPVHKGQGFKGLPVLLTSFEQAKKLCGYSEDWREEDGSPKWGLCQAMFAHFKLFGVGPILVYNIFEPETHKTSVAAQSFNVKEHRALLSDSVLDNAQLVVKLTAEGTDALIKGTDYDVYYTDENAVVELLPTSQAYSAVTLSISCEKADLSAIDAAAVSAAVEKVELCKAVTGVVPELLAAPGFSKNAAVAGVLAAKAPVINGVFKAKAVADIPAGATDTVSNLAVKAEALKDENLILCWLSGVAQGKVFDMSVLACCVMEKTDMENGNVPSESPSNRELPIAGLVNDIGEEMYITLPDADTISYASGVVTAINNDGFVLWGNLMSVGAEEGVEPARAYICTSRMHDFVCNEFVKTYLKNVDKGKTKIQADNIATRFNAWLNGLIGDGKLLAGNVDFDASQTNGVELFNGKFTLNSKIAAPVPMQQISIYVEFDVNMLNGISG